LSFLELIRNAFQSKDGQAKSCATETCCGGSRSEGCCSSTAAKKKVTINPEDYVSEINFTVNGVPFTVNNVDPTMSFNVKKFLNSTTYPYDIKSK